MMARWAGILLIMVMGLREFYLLLSLWPIV